MGVSFEAINEILVANVEGRLDSTNASEIESQLVERLQQRGLIMDFSKLDYISSAGLRVVLIVAKLLKQSGHHFVLVSLPSHIKDVFEISGFLAILDVAGDRNEALSHF